MANPQDIPFTGLASRADDNRTPFSAALKADNCFTDTDAVTGRNGYRSVLAGQITPTGAPQFVGRFRPTINSARAVLVVGGYVLLVKDPSSETSSDGSVVNLGSAFGASDVISGAALGESFYLSTDNLNKSWVRINWSSPDSYTLEVLSAIPQGAQPTFTLNPDPAWVLFNTLSTAVSTGTAPLVQQNKDNTGMGALGPSWLCFTKTNNGNDDPLTGASALFQLPAPFDASQHDWIAIAVSPHDGGGAGPNSGQRVTVQVANQVGGGPAPFLNIGQTYDVPPVGGSPNLLYCDLRNLPNTVRGAIDYIQFLLDGTSGGKFIVYGYVFLPSPPAQNPETFNIDYINAATGEVSTLTSDLVVTISQPILPAYPDIYMDAGAPRATGGGTQQMLTNNPRIFNQQSGILPFPSLDQIGKGVVIHARAPVSAIALTARLWQTTPTGLRLVTTQAVGSGATFTFSVVGGVQFEANQLYQAGGMPPQSQTITAQSARLISMIRNRLYISSFVPTSVNTNPFPQWPDIPLQDSDGWSLDISPSPNEIGQLVDGDGDALYILTNEAWYYMSDLTPNSPVFQVFRRGALGHRAGKYAEDRMFVASWDGVYQGVGRSNPTELTEPIRKLYKAWLHPTSNVCVDYDADTRSLFVFEGTRYLRYRFPQEGEPGRWTRGILAHNIRAAASWNGLVYSTGPTTVPQLWLLSDNYLARWQAGTVRDMQIGTDTATGYPVPDWVYSTGFDYTPEPGIVRGITIDTTDTIHVTTAKTVPGNIPGQARTWDVSPDVHQDEVWQPCAGDLRGQKFRVEFSGPNSATLRRAVWDRDLISGAKGG